MDPNGANNARIASGVIADAVLSPDGFKLVYTKQNQATFAQELWVIEADGSNDAQREADPTLGSIRRDAPRLARIARWWVAGSGRNLRAGPVENSVFPLGPENVKNNAPWVPGAPRVAASPVSKGLLRPD